MNTCLTPLTSVENTTFRTPNQLEGTPVGDRDNGPKIQLCLELRKKDVTKQRSSKKAHQLILEVTVWHVKNLPRREESKQKQTFVKIMMLPGGSIHSTELKMDKQNTEKADLKFMEVFEFSLEKKEDLLGKKLEVLVCDKKMTRNASIFGKTEVTCLDEIKVDKPICRWFNLTDGSVPKDDKHCEKTLTE